MKGKHAFIKQIIGGTCEDTEGEQYSKEFFEDMLKALPSKVPLNQKHEAGLPALGYLENFDLVPSKEKGEWDLIADVHVTSGQYDPSLRGFSFSSTIIEWGNIEAPTECVHIPYPYYNDQKFINELLANSDSLAVGKWVKKEAFSGSAIAIALAIQGVALLISPEWDIQYKENIRPQIIKIIGHITKLNSKDISVDFVQIICGYKEEGIKLYLIPDRNVDVEVYTEEKIKVAIQLAISYLSRDPKAKEVGVSQLKMKYDINNSTFKLFDITYLDNEHIQIV